MVISPRTVLGLGGLLVGAALSGGLQDGPTFSADIAPVINRSCRPCHVAGGPGPFPLETYEDVRKRAKQISDDVGSYHMPPCNASSDFARFCVYEPLSDAEFVTFLEWTTEGLKPGNLSSVARLPAPKVGWRMGPPDMIVRVAPGYAVPSASGPYWRTVGLELPGGLRAIRGFDIRPASPAVVRHVTLARSSAPGPEAARLAGGPSLAGMRPSALIGSWAIGYQPTLLPAGVAVKAKALSVEVQYQPTGRRENGDMELALYFAKRASVPVAWKSLGVSPFSVPPNKDVTLRSEWRLRSDVRLCSLEPDFGFFPVTVSITARYPTGEVRRIARFDHWSPYWQGSYVFPAAVRLPKGTVIAAEARYDNRTQDSHQLEPPAERKLLRSGSSPTDERFHVYLGWTP